MENNFHTGNILMAFLVVRLFKFVVLNLALTGEANVSAFGSLLASKMQAFLILGIN